MNGLDDTSKRTRKFGHFALLWLLIMPLLTVCVMASTIAVESFVPGVVTVVHADPTDDSSWSSSSSDSSSSSSSTSNDASAWNTALSQLSESAVGTNKSSSSDTGNSSNKDQATLDSDVKGHNYLNVWGFMGNGNTDVWEKNNNSSWTVSYNSLIGGAGNKIGDSYKVAGRFAYVLQSTGLDQPVKSGFTSVGVIDKVGGWIMQLSYFVLNSAQSLFKIALSILSAINPINWALYGSSSSNALFSGLASTVHRLYTLMKGVGWAICGIILAGSLSLAAMGVTVGVGTAHVGAGRALLNTFVNLLKRLFIWTVLPVFGLAFFGATINNVQDAFETQSNSVPNYAVYGAFVDYNDWVMNSRLGLPSDVTLTSSFDSKKAYPLTHSQILSINYKGAGVSGLSGLYNNVASNKAALADSTNSDNTNLNDYATSILKSWTSGSSITAADYASAADPDIRAAAKKAAGGSSKSNGSPDLSSELVKNAYNNNSTDTVSDATSNGVITGNTFQSNSDTLSGTAKGGLSTLGTYAYMLTTASDDKMTIADTENLSNDVAQPEHRATVLVGTGIVSTGNLVWAFGMMVGLALLVVGYLLEVLKTIIQSIPAITMATLQTALMSLKGGVQFISVLAGLFIGVFGSAVMYLVAQLAYISVAEFSDSLISGQFTGGAINVLSMYGNSSVGQLATSASATTIQGAANIAYGVFLLWLAYLLLRYRGIVVASLSSVVEETTNKIMATFGNLSGQGSSGTRGAIMQNSNTENTWGNNVAGLAKTAGMGALFAGGTGGLGSLAKGVGSLGKNSANKATGKDTAKEKNNNSKQDTSSSANKLGNAASRTNAGNNTGTSALTNNKHQTQNAANKSDNNLQNPEKTANGNGLSTADKDQGQNQNHLQNTSYAPNQSMQNAGDLNSIGDNDDLMNANQDQLYNADANNLNDVNQNDQNGDQNAGDELIQNGDQNGLENQNVGDELTQNGLGQDVNANDLGSSENGLYDGNNAATTSDAIEDSAMQQDQIADKLGVGQDGSSIQDALTGDNNTLGDSNSSNSAIGNNNLDNSIGDSNNGSAIGDSTNNANNLLGDNNQNSQLGDNLNGNDNQDLRATQLGSSIGDTTNAQNLGQSTANDLSTNVPVNSDISAQTIQSQMGDIQNASAAANTANSLASANPTNQTLSQRAEVADNELSSMQSNALRDYNQQAISSNAPQAQWLGSNADGKSISVGTADNAMNSVYNAQNNVGSATSRYGADSVQARNAEAQLGSARQNAVNSGLSSKVVNDTKAVNAAHNVISENASNLMKGTWKPQASNKLNSVSHLGNDTGRTIGI